MDLLLYFGLFRTYIHGKQRLGPLYHEIGFRRPVARVFTYKSWISGGCARGRRRVVRGGRPAAEVGHGEGGRQWGRVEEEVGAGSSWVRSSPTPDLKTRVRPTPTAWPSA
jgi:hypothetical protein